MYKESCGIAKVPVVRRNGADGVLKCRWKTKDITAIGGKDFENTEGEISFAHGECEKDIEIIIKDDLVCIVTITMKYMYVYMIRATTNLSMGFPTKKDSNQSYQLQRLARKSEILLVESIDIIL